MDLTIDDELDLRPDMTVTVEIEVGRVQSALLVPSWLIRDFGSESPWLMVVVDGEARRRDVELGLEGDDLVEVVSGLSEDDEVLPPALPIEEGDPVRVRRTRPAVELEGKGEN